MRWPYVSRAGLRQNHEWLVGGLELGVAVTRSGWPRTAIYYTIGAIVVRSFIYIMIFLGPDTVP